MKRRNWFKTVGGLSVSALLSSCNNGRTIQNRNRVEYDILVIGGGTAGVVAALQAARAGCSTALVEAGSQLGGTITTGGVTFPGLFHAWGRQIIGGIGWELVTEAARLGNTPLPNFIIPFGKSHPKHQVFLNRAIYSLIAEEKCLEAGVALRFYETPIETSFDNGRWQTRIIGKGTDVTIRSKQIVDCTGNAFVAKLIGYPLLREEETQPGSLIFELDGVEIDRLDKADANARLQQAIQNGTLRKSDLYGNAMGALTSKVTSVQHIIGADSSTSELHTQANIEGRRSMLRILRFYRTVPGCEQINIKCMQAETAVRETYRIDGLYRITLNDYVSGTIHDDSLCYSFYPIDLHDSSGVTPDHLAENIVATIPLRALIPKGSTNFMVAGRSVCSDRRANSALRVQASCMAMGQAAGAAAALACQTGSTPAELSIDKLKGLIAQHGGIVPNS